MRGETAIITAAWEIYQRAGPRQLVLAGVLATSADRQRYQRAVGMAIRSVRLEAGEQVRSARLAGRYGLDRGVALRWHLQRHQQLAARLASAGLDEAVIATDDLGPRTVAQEVLAHFERDSA